MSCSCIGWAFSLVLFLSGSGDGQWPGEVLV